MKSLLELSIRPCTLQFVATAPRPDWWKQHVHKAMISILDEIPTIEKSMMNERLGGTFEQVDFIQAFVLLIGDVYMNAVCPVPKVASRYRLVDDQASVMLRNYGDYVKLIRRIRPQVDDAMKPCTLASILRGISRFGFRAPDHVSIQIDLIELACKLECDQEYPIFSALEWLDAREYIHWHLYKFGRTSRESDYYPEITLLVQLAEIQISKRLLEGVFHPLRDPQTGGRPCLDTQGTICLQHQLLQKHSYGSLDCNRFRQIMYAFLGSVEVQD